MKESDLYAPVRDWLKERGYDPKAEVKGTDIMARKGDTMLSVELKVTLNLEVILQAVDRQRLSEVVYIAVPKKGRLLFTKRWRMLLHLLKRLELGLLLVSTKTEPAMVEEVVQPIPFDRAKSWSQAKKKRQSSLKEFDKRHGDHNTGGVNKVKLITAYRENALMIAHLLSVHGPLSIKKLRELGADKEKSAATLQKNFYNWFVNISKGVYDLSDSGRKAIEEYANVVDTLKPLVVHDALPLEKSSLPQRSKRTKKKKGEEEKKEKGEETK
ncbi:MAG: DUF2161 family putative PD-(D/E)XK-type phosphodiesterase, partial [Clostridia bacterium]|nr:DUF2161 family putative PD-(D/E)XK-type phosphodiesterase [Clostridia bacterium]